MCGVCVNMEKSETMKKIFTLVIILVAAMVASAQVPAVPGGDNDDPVFTVVEQEPEFTGGIEALYQYIATNVKYPEEAKASKIKGRVLVSFVVEKDGSISNIKVKQCPDEALCEEAMRVVRAMPRWKPGMVKGKKVRAQYVLPINFTLN